MAEPTRAVVTHGTFDGVHVGHAALVAETVRQARVVGAEAVVVTYDPHPREVLRGEAVPRLTSADERIERLLAAGADRVEVVAFTRELAAMEADAFARDVLVGRFGAVHVVAGHDHRYGAQRGGTLDALRAQGAALGFGVTVVGPVDAGGAPVSSSRLRRALVAGDVAGAEAMLGRRYALGGTVVGGDRIGRTLGFPTANLRADDARLVVPAHGVYAARAVVEAASEDRAWPGDAVAAGVYDALVSVGVRPTFAGPGDVRVEAWLYDVSGDLYERRVRIEFAERLRGEARFDGADALVAQMREDAVLGARLLGRLS